MQIYLVAAALPTARGEADICRFEGTILSIFVSKFLLITNSLFGIEKLW